MPYVLSYVDSVGRYKTRTLISYWDIVCIYLLNVFLKLRTYLNRKGFIPQVENVTIFDFYNTIDIGGLAVLEKK